MKQLLLFLLLTVAISCKKDDEAERNYGCVWGKKISTGVRTFIRCGDYEIYLAGNNQTAADAIATNKGIPKENVAVMTQYSNWEFIPNNNCTCQ